MGLDLLDTPVRLTWDFAKNSEGQVPSSMTAIADCIVDAGVFFVVLQGTPLCHPDLPGVLERLAGRCQLLLGCQGQPEELQQLAGLALPPCQLLLDVGSCLETRHGIDSERIKAVLAELRRLGHEPILTLTPLRSNLLKIPDLLKFCAEHQVPRIKLPNAHIGDSFDQYSAQDLPRWQDLEQFRERWVEFAKHAVSLPAMEIHDLFLWEIMTPDQQQNRSEYGGCQAGNSLAHVDCHGVVHPCSAWPQPLGRLPGQSLQEIWSGQERLLVTRQIASTPDGCVDCRDLDICFGGCRGLSSHLNRAAAGRDLMCSGPR